MSCSQTGCDNALLPFTCDSCILEFCIDCYEQHLTFSEPYKLYSADNPNYTCIYCFITVQFETIRDFNMCTNDQIEWVER